eukprot:1751804-Ditylum_brightwellii.AAC.1
MICFLYNTSNSETSSWVDSIDSGNKSNLDAGGEVNRESMEMDSIDSSSINTAVERNNDKRITKTQPLLLSSCRL